MQTIIAISGSLRSASINTTLLNIVATRLPSGIEYNIFESVGDLPHFNPDVDKGEPLPAVQHLRDQIREAAAVVICTPDSISASPLYRGGDRAHAPLSLILEALGTKQVARVTIPAITTKLNREGHLNHPETLQELDQLAQALVAAIQPLLIDGRAGLGS